MEHIEVNDPLPTPIAKLLITLVDVAERNQVLDMEYKWSDEIEPGTFDLFITCGAEKLPKITCKGEPLESLAVLGLIKMEGKLVVLYPAAFKRAKYERKSPVGKWIERTVSKWHDTIVVLSFVVSVAAVVISIVKP
jgi:hypothetical protein